MTFQPRGKAYANEISRRHQQRCRHFDLTSATKLRILDCSSCRLEGDLDLSACPDLQSLDCSGNLSLTRILLNSNCASSVKITKDAQCIISY